MVKPIIIDTPRKVLSVSCRLGSTVKSESLSTVHRYRFCDSMFVSCTYSETQLSVCVYLCLNFTDISQDASDGNNYQRAPALRS